MPPRGSTTRSDPTRGVGRSFKQDTSDEAMTIDEAITDPEKRERYLASHDRLYLDLIVEAHECLRHARAILGAPLWLLSPGPALILYRIAVALLREAALITINALLDNRKDALTFAGLRRELLSVCDDSIRPAMREQLKRGFEENSIADPEKRAIKLRHRLLAHYNWEDALRPERRREIGITVRQLAELLEKAKGLLHVLKPGVSMSFDVERIGREQDMAYVMELVVRDSKWLAMPEKVGEAGLRSVAENWSETQKRIFNQWRGKIGRPEIDFDR